MKTYCKYVTVRSLMIVFCFYLIMSSWPLTVRAASGDEVRAAKKIMSFVYDDSGSMEGESWGYANYAAQALTSLLNEQDELYITYLSQPSTPVRVDLKNIDKAVKNIHDWNRSAGTPPEAITTARKLLDNVKEQDRSVEFWLVVMTDGAFNDFQHSDLQNALDGYKGNKMSNGSGLNVVYFGMGSSAWDVKEDPQKQLYSYHTDSDKEIVSQMNEMANLISGRIVVSNAVQMDDHTVSFSSSLPLYSISVLSQQSTAQVTSAATEEESLNVARNIPVTARNLYSISMDLFGNASVINKTDDSGNSQVIPAGTYSITFSEPVKLEDLVIQYEPAIGFKAVLKKDGVVVTDTSGLSQDDKVDISIIPVVPGTDEVIDEDDLPANASWSVEYQVDDNVIESVKGLDLPGVKLQEGDNKIVSSLNIPGFSPLTREIEFQVNPLPAYNFGIAVNQPNPLNYFRDGSDLDEKGGVTFTITNDGQPMSLDELKNAGVKLKIEGIDVDNKDVKGFFNIGWIKSGCRLEQNADGTYTLTPKIGRGKAWLVQSGKYAVTVYVSEDESVTEQAEFSLIPQAGDWGSLPFFIIGLLLLLYLLFIIFVKEKFNGQTIKYEEYRISSEGKGILVQGATEVVSFEAWSGHLLLPLKSSFRKWHGLKFVAGSEGTIIVDGKSIAETVYAYGKSNQDPVKKLGSISTRLKQTERQNGSREASDQPLGNKSNALYLRSTKTGTLWRVYIV